MISTTTEVDDEPSRKAMGCRRAPAAVRARYSFGIVSTGAVGWACLKRICMVCYSIKRREIEGGCCVVVWLFQGRSMKGNGSFRTSASAASASMIMCVRVVVGFCLVRSTKGNGSFRTSASAASASKPNHPSGLIHRGYKQTIVGLVHQRPGETS